MFVIALLPSLFACREEDTDITADPVDAYVGTWLQTEDHYTGDCATQYQGTIGIYNEFTKVDATSATLRACSDAGCDDVLWDAGTWTFDDQGGCTTAFNMTWQPKPELDCTYRQTNELACPDADETCTWVVVAGDRLSLYGTFVVTEESGTQCAEALAALQAEYGNSYPMDGCRGAEVVTMIRP